MSKLIYLSGLAVIVFCGGMFNLKDSIANPVTEVSTETKTETSTAENVDETWRSLAMEQFEFSYQNEKDDGGYAISENELPLWSDSSVAFKFDTADLKYGVVKALVKEIYIKNDYTSYQLYKHILKEDAAMHQETGVEVFIVQFDLDQYWLITYCQGKAYAYYDDEGVIVRERQAEALTIPGEAVLYGFPFKNSSLWMVVCTKGVDKDYLVCRIGNPADKSILLEYPQDLNNSWEHFTFTLGHSNSKEPQNGEVMFKQSLAYEGETSIYTILEEDVYKDGTYDPEVSFLVSNKTTGAEKRYEGKGEMSDTVGVLGNNFFENEKLKIIEEGTVE